MELGEREVDAGRVELEVEVGQHRARGRVDVRDRLGARRAPIGGVADAATSSRIRSRNRLALAKKSGADQRTMSSPGTCSASG